MKLLNLICFSLLLSGCSGLGGQFKMGNISPSEALNIGSDVYEAATLSDQDVAVMASQVAAHEDRANKIASAENPYSKRLAKIVNGHKSEDGLRLNYKVYLSPEVNAFSLADGTVRVYTGLLDKMTDDEVLFVIGHEIGHVKNGHSKSRMQRAYAASAATKAVNASVSSRAGAIGAALGADVLSSLASEVITSKFSRGDETESDEYGLQFVHKSGRNPDAAASALMKLGDGEGESKGLSIAQFTSSHPDPIARAEHLRKLRAELAPFTGVADVVVAQDSISTTAEVSGEVEVAVEVAQDSAEISSDSIVTASISTEPSVEADIDLQNASSAVNTAASYHPNSAAIGAKKGWFIQVGAFAEQERALQVNAILVQHAKPARINTRSLRNAPLHRVIVGPFASRAAAQEQLVEVLAIESISQGAYVRQLSN